MRVRWGHWAAGPRLAPLVGAAIGAVGGAVYWMGAQIWPTSVAVVLSILATALLGERTAAQFVKTEGAASAGFVFAVLIKYSALMALSAANLPFALPANLALGLIMIVGHASSRALAVSMAPSPSRSASSRPSSHADLFIALLLGFVPAALIGMPGLIGLAAAVVARIALVAYLRRHHTVVSPSILDMSQEITQACFYLGALGAWAYV